MTAKKVFILCGHPDSVGLCHDLAETYERSARDAGHSVNRLNIGAMKLPSGKRSVFWHRMFRGKSARIILTSGTNPWMVWLLPGNVNAQLKWGILWFAGFSVHTTWFGPSENIPAARKARWLAKVGKIGKEGK